MLICIASSSCRWLALIFSHRRLQHLVLVLSCRTALLVRIVPHTFNSIWDTFNTLDQPMRLTTRFRKTTNTAVPVAVPVNYSAATAAQMLSTGIALSPLWTPITHQMINGFALDALRVGVMAKSRPVESWAALSVVSTRSTPKLSTYHLRFGNTSRV